MTVAEFLALPEEKPYLEYVDGVVVQKPMVSAAHGRIVRMLDYWFHVYIVTHGGDAGPERTMRLSETQVRLPDTAYWAPGRPSGDNSIPTVAVEVRSEGQPLEELRAKCRAYRASGVEACWLIDPGARTVEVWEGAGEGARLPQDGALGAAAMPGFDLPLSEIFAVLDVG